MSFYSGEIPVTRELRTSTLSNYEYDETVDKTETIWMAVWVPSPDEFEQLEVGERRENTRMLESRFELTVGDDGEDTESGESSDILEIDGERFKVVGDHPELYPRQDKFTYTAVKLENG